MKPETRALIWLAAVVGLAGAFIGTGRGEIAIGIAIGLGGAAIFLLLAGPLTQGSKL